MKITEAITLKITEAITLKITEKSGSRSEHARRGFFFSRKVRF